jgi:methyl-accepting chemotaxis protein
LALIWTKSNKKEELKMSVLERFKAYGIATKLKIPVIVLSVVIAFSSVFGLVSIKVLGNASGALANEYLPGVDLVLQADRDLFQAQVAERSMIFMNARSAEFADMVASHQENVAQSKERVEKFVALTSSDTLRDQATMYLKLHDEWAALTNRIKDERSADTRIGRTNAMELSFGPAFKTFEEMRAILDKLGTSLQSDAGAVADTTNSAESFALTQQVLCALIALLTCYVLVRRFPALILGPLNQLMDGMNHVRINGDFSYRIRVDSQDEIADAAKSFNEVVGSLETIIAQCENTVSAVANGDFDQTIEVRFEGDLNRLAQSINNAIASVKSAMQCINEITQDLADGDFKKRTSEGMAGEFERTVANANHAKDSLRSTIEECSGLVLKIAEGDFSGKITRDYPGDLGALKRGVNSAVEGMSLTMGTIREAMSALERGDFKYRSDRALTGQFADTVDSVMRAMQQLDLAIEDISLVMSQLMRGNFNQQVSVETRGGLETLKNSINGTIKVFESTTAALRLVMSSLAQGDLTQSVTLSCQGSFDQLKQGMNSTIERLTDMIASIRAAADEVAAASAELNDGSNHLSVRTETQVSSIEKTHLSILDIIRAGDENLNFAKKAVAKCEMTGRTAKNGEEAVELVIDAVRNISTSSSKIGSILSVIDGIAFQTNLLALNAAVEAARAGDKGRGFAVVAGEVRQLAQRSSAAAKEIKTLISEIVDRVEYGESVANNAGGVLKRIIDDVGSVSDAVFSITEAVAMQRKGIENIKATVTMMEQNTQETAAMSEEVAASSNALSEQSRQLLALSASFKVAQA